MYSWSIFYFLVCPQIKLSYSHTSAAGKSTVLESWVEDFIFLNIFVIVIIYLQYLQKKTSFCKFPSGHTLIFFLTVEMNSQKTTVVLE